jgi:hypothetical protein
MRIVERVIKIILTFVVFVITPDLLAGSINTMFDLIPLRIERLYPKEYTGRSEAQRNTLSASEGNEGIVKHRVHFDCGKVRSVNKQVEQVDSGDWVIMMDSIQVG